MTTPSPQEYIPPRLQTWLTTQGFTSVDRNRDGLMAGETALHGAVKLHDDEMVELLLKIRPNFAFLRDSKGRTALHCIAREERITDATISCTNQLIRHGSQVSSRDKYGQTPLHQVVRFSPVGVERLLHVFLEAGGDALVADDQGITVMQLALRSNGQGAAKGHEYLMGFLSQRRSDLEISLSRS
eukprot:m.117840 g.117840  ORF g.117840 m.117840 type:complete len:185 (-) comp28610_c0_seq2:285-839(-)